MGAGADRHGRPGSHPRSSNRTCRFPASGFPTGFFADSRKRLHLEQCLARAPCAAVVLRLPIQFVLKFPDFIEPCQTCVNSHSFPPSQTHQKQGSFPPPELPGFIGTSDPLRHPDDPPSIRRRSRFATPRPSRASPTCADYLSGVLCSLPRWTGSVHDGYRGGVFLRRVLPNPFSLPRFSAGSASTLYISRPAQALHALRPARLFAHHTWTLSRGFDHHGYPCQPLVSYRI